ncbi:hypothetical protein [Corynebacterium sp.]|nr:hypothetical protein [Corynebacterium sp.]MDY5784677.1 hypothetical protein [Corynebacterium sp.]
MASAVIEFLEDCPINRYGILGLRRALSTDEFGYAAYLGDLSDTTKAI